jgi:hypothetical protein
MITKQPGLRRIRTVALCLEMCRLKSFLVRMYYAEGLSHLPLFSAQPRFHNFIERLVTTTNDVIITRSRKISVSSKARRTEPRMSPVTLAWSVSQRASRDLNVQAAIE